MNKIINHTLNLLLVTVLMAVVISCSLVKGREPAEAAVKQFHNQYNEGQFHEIYNKADDEFKKSVSEEEFVKLLEALRKKLGTVKQADQIQWNVNSTTGGTFVTLGYNVDFSEGKGTEQFVFDINGDNALLYNYNVNSPLLITK